MRTFAQKPEASQQTTSATPQARFGPSREASSIVQLQRTIGNQAVRRRLEAGRGIVQRDTPGPEKSNPETKGGDPSVGSAKAATSCVPPSGFPWFEVAPDRFMSLTDDEVQMSPPGVTAVGCSPGGGAGRVYFFAGRPGGPAWKLSNACDNCTAPASEKKDMPKVEIGYIQTVEKALSGGVYYKRNPAGQWEWSGNHWLCVSNARDGHATSVEPWFGPDPNGNFGPVLYPQYPHLMDNPVVSLPSRKDGGTLRRMRIDGTFHIWLIAKPEKGPIVFMHHWTIECWVVTELDDQGEPCSPSAWTWMHNGNTVKSKGAGKGSASPVLSGQTANQAKQPC